MNYIDQVIHPPYWKQFLFSLFSTRKTQLRVAYRREYIAGRYFIIKAIRNREPLTPLAIQIMAVCKIISRDAFEEGALYELGRHRGHINL